MIYTVLHIKYILEFISETKMPLQETKVTFNKWELPSDVCHCRLTTRKLTIYIYALALDPP